MRATICTLGLCLCPGLVAGGPKDGGAIDPQKLLGKWVAREGAKGGFEFKKGGAVVVTASLGGEPLTLEGTYTVEGRRVVLRVEFGDNQQATPLTVVRLTDAELVIKDAKGAESTLVRPKTK